MIHIFAKLGEGSFGDILGFLCALATWVVGGRRRSWMVVRKLRRPLTERLRLIYGVRCTGSRVEELGDGMVGWLRVCVSEVVSRDQ